MCFQLAICNSRRIEFHTIVVRKILVLSRFNSRLNKREWNLIRKSTVPFMSRRCFYKHITPWRFYRITWPTDYVSSQLIFQYSAKSKFTSIIISSLYENIFWKNESQFQDRKKFKLYFILITYPQTHTGVVPLLFLEIIFASIISKKMKLVREKKLRFVFSLIMVTTQRKRYCRNSRHMHRIWINIWSTLAIFCFESYTLLRWNIAESGVKHQKSNQIIVDMLQWLKSLLDDTYNSNFQRSYEFWIWCHFDDGGTTILIIKQNNMFALH
jgi:hypothetical protein